MINLPVSMNVDVSKLSQVFNSTSASYKFYWFIAILQLMTEKNDDFLSIHSILSRMVVNAWYPVNFCHLKLGASDRVGQVIHSLVNDCGYEVVLKRDRLDDKLNRADAKIRRTIGKLGEMVPYRFLSPWTGSFGRNACNRDFMMAAQNEANNTPYYFVTENGVKGIKFRRLWLDYFLRNNRILLDFAYFNLATYIQNRNPEASGLLFKIDYSQFESRPPLVRQHRFWDEYVQMRGFVHSLYSSTNHNSDYRYDLDHFMPWTFVAHNQIWNLTPIEDDLNSSKSNKLPSLSLVKELAKDHFGLFHYHFEKNRENEILLEYANLGEPIETLATMPVDSFIGVYEKKMTALHEAASSLGFADWKMPESLSV